MDFREAEYEYSIKLLTGRAVGNHFSASFPQSSCLPHSTLLETVPQKMVQLGAKNIKVSLGAILGLRSRLFDSKVFPLLIDRRLRFVVHQNLVRPGTDKAFRRPFTRGVNAHLRAEVGQACGAVEGVHGSERGLDVALGTDVSEQ